jgi:hypothetical protein
MNFKPSALPLARRAQQMRSQELKIILLLLDEKKVTSGSKWNLNAKRRGSNSYFVINTATVIQ